MTGEISELLIRIYKITFDSEKEDSMFKFKWLVVLFLLVTAVQTSFADDIAKVNGVWKLVSYDVEVQATGDKFLPWARARLVT